ncbi:MAG: hypothetical protein ACI4YA_01495 [Candidatus Spyradenecus sp.]
MLDPDLQARVERRLEDGEHLVWYAKPRPSAWFPKWPVVVSVGIFWCCLLAWKLWSVLSPSTVPVEGRTAIVFKVITDAIPFTDRLARSTFLLPFFAIGIGMLFSPLWHWLGCTRYAYAVTNRRALYIGRIGTHAIRATDFLAPRCINHRNGLSDLFFLETATVNRFTNAPTSTYLEGFRNLAAAEAPAAEAALRALYAQAHPASPTLQRKLRLTRLPRANH